MTWYNSQLISAPHSRVEVVKVNSVNSHCAVIKTAWKHAKKASKKVFFISKMVEWVSFKMGRIHQSLVPTGILLVAMR